jgi:hypothetical protein
VTAGAGLGGGGTGENVSLFVDFTQTQKRVGGTCPAESSIRQINSDGSVICEVDSGGNGDITAVTTGPGLVGGGTSGDVLLAIGTNMVTGLMIQNGAITTADIAVDAIDSFRIANGAVTGSDVATGAIGSPQINDGSVTAMDIATSAVGSDEVVDHSITSNDLAASAVGSEAIATGAVGTLEVENGSLKAIDMLDEAGANFNSETGSTFLRPSLDTFVVDVVLALPAPGTVIVTASGTFAFDHATFADDVGCSIIDEVVPPMSYEIQARESTEKPMDRVPFSGTRGFRVPQGTKTFYLVCKPNAGTVSVVNPAITAIYVSSTY